MPHKYNLAQAHNKAVIEYHCKKVKTLDKGKNLRRDCLKK